MTDGTKASVWDAVWLPYGGTHSITGTASNNARFPGQWFQLESDLHYNWHRSYDPTTGRYTKADPLGLDAGPNLYAYANNTPQMLIDPDGRNPLAAIGALCARFPAACAKVGRAAANFCKRAADQVKTRFSAKPSDAQMDTARRILREHGKNSLEKARRSLDKQVRRHESKIRDAKRDGGHTSSMRREVHGFNRQIRAINKVLGK